VEAVAGAKDRDAAELIVGGRFQALGKARWKAEGAAVGEADDDAFVAAIVSGGRSAGSASRPA
jgi:hypothetical protein